jgi:hypothetical protein
MKRLSTSEFIIRAINIHGTRYDYSKTDYINNWTKIEIICPFHGSFWQIPANHLKNKGCCDCGYNKLRNTVEEFVSKASEMHNNKYDYSNVNYSNNINKINIICPKHGIFYQSPTAHLSGHGCPKCKNDIVKKIQLQTIDDFLKRAKIIHGYRYDYSLVVYNGCETNVRIICKKHGEFLQAPNNHLNSKQGCPKCFQSKGENKISLWLDNNKIKYIHQKKFDGCTNPETNYKLRYDFYIPSKNLVIEYDGEQHYKLNPRLRKYKFTQKDVDKIKYRDELKTSFAARNNIKLLRISYLEKNKIDNILLKEIL